MLVKKAKVNRTINVNRYKRYIVVFTTLLSFMLITVNGFLIYEYISNTFDIYVIVTSSMEPSIPRGSIVIVRSLNLDSESPAIGDVLAYRISELNNIVFAHRLIEIMPNGDFVLKGDAVNSEDIINRDSVIGVVIYGIPGGIYLAIALPYIAFILLVLSLIEGKG